MISRYKGLWLSLKRLKGVPLSTSFRYLYNGILGEVFRIRTFGALGLRLVEISLTDRCQCQCRHCFASTKQPLSEEDEFSLAEIAQLIDDIAEMGVTEVCLSGGEPLLRRDILDIVTCAHDRGLVVRLITNGIALSEDVVRELKQAGCSWCSVSIDSPKAEAHDDWRQYAGCFDKAVAGLRTLVKHKVPCSIITVARKDLIQSGELEEIVKMGQEMGVTIVRINFPVPIGRFQNQNDQVLSLPEREKVRRLLRYGNVTMEAPTEGTRCTAAITKVNILANGDVTPCVFVPLSYGNIRERAFSEIWKTMAEYNKHFTAKGQCPMCDRTQRERLFAEAEKRWDMQHGAASQDSY
jgi:MoaA/NifB/PqqE/SkfB family radical SAM enzyme